METSQDIVSCYPVNPYVAGSHVMKEFTFSEMKVRVWRSFIYRSNPKIQDFIHWYRLQSHMKGHEKDSIHHISLSPNISSFEGKTKVHLFWSAIRRRIRFFLYVVTIQSWTKFRSNLLRRQIFVIFNDCQDMLQNVDEIISLSFPVIRVSNWRLTNIEVGFMSQPFFLINNWIASLTSAWNWLCNSKRISSGIWI